MEPLLSEAEHEAEELGHNYVRSEHLVLAIVRLAEPAFREVLTQQGVFHNNIAEAVVRLLRPQGQP